MSKTVHELVAIHRGVKSRNQQEIDTAYHTVKKADFFRGMTREYSPYTEDGEKLDSESSKVQLLTPAVINQVIHNQTQIWDSEYSVDLSNCQAKADIIVDSETLVTGVPATTLLFLEKQLTNLRSFITALPQLDPSQDWKEDSTIKGLYKSEPKNTIRTKKVQKILVTVPPTDKFPAQTHQITEDEPVGSWKQVLMSGAISGDRKLELYGRVNKLIDAVKQARERANNCPAINGNLGAVLLNYVVVG